jgi:hypothetical protein
MKSKLRPSEISAWFREQAAEFIHMADMVDSTFGSDGTPAVASATNSNGHAVASVPGTGMPTLNKIKFLVSNTQMRVGEIAEELATTREQIIVLVDQPDSGLARNERGWVKIKDE